MNERRRLCSLIALAVVMGLLTITPVFSQEQPATLAPKALRPLTRPAASFQHDAHNEKAGLNDCVVCHHAGKNGVIVPGESSEGTDCAECHPKDAKTGHSLINAFHQQCKGCHEKQGKGPITCGECHVRP